MKLKLISFLKSGVHKFFLHGFYRFLFAAFVTSAAYVMGEGRLDVVVERLMPVIIMGIWPYILLVLYVYSNKPPQSEIELHNFKTLGFYTALFSMIMECALMGTIAITELLKSSDPHFGLVYFWTINTLVLHSLVFLSFFATAKLPESLNIKDGLKI